jgi:hypothetical protein
VIVKEWTLLSSLANGTINSCLLVGGKGSANWIYNDLDVSPARVGVGVSADLLSHSESLELGIIETETANQIGAYHRGASLRQKQVFLGVSCHAGVNDHNRNSKIIGGKKPPCSTQGILVLELGCVYLVEKVFWLVSELSY